MTAVFKKLIKNVSELSPPYCAELNPESGYCGYEG